MVARTVKTTATGQYSPIGTLHCINAIVEGHVTLTELSTAFFGLIRESAVGTRYLCLDKVEFIVGAVNTCTAAKIGPSLY